MIKVLPSLRGDKVDEAIPKSTRDCFASLVMTDWNVSLQGDEVDAAIQRKQGIASLSLAMTVESFFIKSVIFLLFDCYIHKEFVKLEKVK